ncbi:hypothetical protein DICPUDRAFT_154549 [Dictyostelium purpureum]|uniref:Uncharacterized protein n=1 Tax=Dictyostelium purpureum TaxID=5786 RepID=F0ZRM2_DICPU|nr:uncharacterized protein DICPUDRAFT_154549 [Dictyostelium purpureum]EGC33407.1 hypothetical protein DICPUDRAFT_154549 [Dictyostelium purpureum]|eukprot:XP_003290071.1 hypothetical protein DICPUDRAFT_154549 [Dictyostelium purpureum]
MVRSKVHYPSYYEFCIYEKSAYKELIKSKIVQNNHYEASIKRVNKCYGNLQTELDGNVIPESVKLVSKYREEEVRVFERIIEIIQPDEYEESEDSSFPFTDSMSADERRRVITLTFYLKRILSIRELSCFGEQARFKASGRTALQVYSETTGLTSNAENIELSCACLNGEAFYRKSNPTISITPESTKINKLTCHDLAGHQYWEKVEEEFFNFIVQQSSDDDAPIYIIAHNEKYDRGRIAFHLTKSTKALESSFHKTISRIK